MGSLLQTVDLNNKILKTKIIKFLGCQQRNIKFLSIRPSLKLFANALCKMNDEM